MNQSVVMITRIDDLDNPARLTEVWRSTMPEIAPSQIRAENYLDEMEQSVMEVGWAAMRS